MTPRLRFPSLIVLAPAPPAPPNDSCQIPSRSLQLLTTPNHALEVAIAVADSGAFDLSLFHEPGVIHSPLFEPPRSERAKLGEDGILGSRDAAGIVSLKHSR